MGNKINAKLGLKPQTRTRQATHGALIVSSVRCPRPECGCRHVIRTPPSPRALGAYMCGACGRFFDLPNG